MAASDASSSLRLSAPERDVLYAEIVKVFESGRIGLVEAQLLERDWESARVTGIECSDLLRLVTDDLGWGPRASGDPVRLSTDPEVLGRCSEHLPAYRGVFTSGGCYEKAPLAPYIRHRITGQQRNALFDMTITRLSGSEDVALFLRTERWSDLPALASEMSDLLRFMVDALVPRSAEREEEVEIALPADGLVRAGRILKSFSASTEAAVEVQLLDGFIPLIKELDRARVARDTCDTIMAAGHGEAA
jgi:hypothetical protein